MAKGQRALVLSTLCYHYQVQFVSPFVHSPSLQFEGACIVAAWKEDARTSAIRIRIGWASGDGLIVVGGFGLW